MYLESNIELADQPQHGSALAPAPGNEDALASDLLDLEAAAKLAAHPNGFWQGIGYAQVVDAWESVAGRLPATLARHLEAVMQQLASAARVNDADSMRRAYDAIGQSLSLHRRLT